MTEATLGRAADRVAQACCCLAVLAIPLYFSALTTTSYEPDKAALLRVIAAVAGLAWILATAASGRSSIGRADFGVLAAALAVVLAYAVATALSIDPRLSLWGSQPRQEGLWTRAAYLVILVVVATRLRDRRSIDRLIDSALLGSFVAAAYGIAQQAGLDPVPSTGDPSTLAFPVRSSLGQHVFFGSYLVFMVPLAAARLIGTWERRVADRPGEPPAPAAIALLVGLTAVLMTFFGFVWLAVSHQSLFAAFPAVLAAYLAGMIVFTRRFSPVQLPVARTMYAGLLILQLAALYFSGARSAWLGALAVIPVFGLLLTWKWGRPGWMRAILAVSVVGGIVLTLLNIPGGPLQSLRTVHGVQRLANITDSGGATGSAQGRLLIWHGVDRLLTQDPSVGNRWGGPLRDVVGYGPETLHYAFEAVFPLQLRRVTSEIWTWDRAHDIYLDLLTDAGILGLLGFLALIVFAIRALVLRLREANRLDSLLPIALLAAIAGHLFDGVFGLETETTLLLLFVFAGIAASPGLRVADPTPIEEQDSTVRWGHLAGAILVPLVLGVCAAAAGGSSDLLAGVWTVSILAGIALAGATIPNVASAYRQLRVGHAVGLAAAVVVASVALASQYRFETAAIAYGRGTTELNQGQSLAALPDLQQAVRFDGVEPEYEAELGSAYLSLAAAHGDSADPLYTPDAEQTRTLSATHANLLGNDQLMRLSELSLQAERNMAPLDPDSYNNLGNLYLAWGHVNQATAMFQQAEALSHQNPRYLDQQALALLAGGSPATARQQAARALALDPGFWYSYYTLSVVDQRVGNHSQARQAASVALNLVSNYWPPPSQNDVQQLKALQKAG